MTSEDSASGMSSSTMLDSAGQTKVVVYIAGQGRAPRRIYSENSDNLTVVPMWTYLDYAILCAGWSDQVWFTDMARDGDSLVIYSRQGRAQDTAIGALPDAGSRFVGRVLDR